MQELFDTAVSGVIAQGRKSSTERGQCKYRHPEGLKCAVGHLIEDEHYRSYLEGLEAQNPNVARALQRSIGRNLTHAEFEILADLQCAHDEADSENFVMSFKDRARSVASNQGLEWNHGE